MKSTHKLLRTWNKPSYIKLLNIMETITILKVSAANYLRIQCMQYSSVDILKDQVLLTGSTVIIECANELISNYNKTKLVRKIIDFDSIELITGKKPTYTLILANENFCE